MTTLTIQVQCEIEEDAREMVSRSIQSILENAVPYMADNVSVTEI